MAARVIKLAKRDDIASVVKQIKNLRDREVIFELESGSILLKSSDTMKLMKRTAEVLGKKIQVKTSDEVGRILAKKAGVLVEDGEDISQSKPLVRVARSDVKPRFSDISGPRRIPRPKTHNIATVEESEPESDEVIEQTVPRPRPKSSVNFSRFRHWYTYAIASLVIIIVALFALSIILPKADIIVSARSEPVTRDFEMSVDKSVSQFDANKLIIPGIPVSREVSLTKNFVTTGNNPVGQKAAGSVVLYNFTKNTLTLRATTTTLVANGKKYTFNKDITGLKPTGGTQTDPDESTLISPIPIIAVEAGDNYNTPPDTKFEVVNAALGNQPVYGITSVGIQGGITTPGKALSQEDLDHAVGALTEAIIEQAESDLTQEKGSPVKLLSANMNKEILASAANKNVGDKVDDFDMTIIAKITGLGFFTNDVTEVAVSKIKEVLSSDKYLLENSESQYKANFKSIDVPAGKGVLTVHFETVAAYKVDSTNLSKILAGKNESEIKEILLSKPEVDDVTVEFWPSWFVHKAPKFNGKVEIKTVLGE